MQTMLHFLENDHDRLLQAVTSARTPEKTQEAVVAQLDRLLYQYNEQDVSDRLKEAAANMIQTARHMAAVLTGYGDVRVWERASASAVSSPRLSCSRWPASPLPCGTP